MSEIKMMWAYIQAFAHEQGNKDRDERGASTIELVIIGGGLAVLAIAAVAVIASKVSSKANSIPTN